MASHIANLRMLSAGTADARAAAMVRFCLDRARECRRFAEGAASASQRRSWLEMEGRWFFLARSYDNQRRAVRREEMAIGRRCKDVEILRPALGNGQAPMSVGRR